MKRFYFAVSVLGLLLLPAAAFAGTTVTATPPYPGATVNAGTRVSFSVIASGFSNPTYSVIDSFGGGANNSNIDGSGSFFWNTNISEIGTHNITINVSDSSGNSGSVVQTVTVNGGPTVTVQSPANSTVTVGNPVSFTLTPQGFFNPTYSVADSFYNSSLRGTAMGADGTFNWTPIMQDIGVHTITVTAKDSLGYSATSSQTLTVLPTPTMTIDALTPGYTMRPGQALSFVATTTGLIHPTYTIADTFNTTTTTSASIDAKGKVSWAPQPNDVGVHAFIITASDSGGRSLAATMSITVQPGAYLAPPAPAATTTAAASAPVQTNQAVQPAPAAKAYLFTKYLQVGSTGADVTALQQILISGGFLGGSATGYFGALTKRAIMSYQTAHGVQALGVVGPATRALLNRH